MLQGSNQYIDYLQGGTANLQGGSPYLQGSSPNLQPQQPTVAPKAASPSATSSVTKTPSAQSYINDLSSRYGLSGGTVYDKSTNSGLSLDQFKTSSGISNPNWSQLKFDTAYSPMSFGSQQQTSAPITAPATMPANPPASKPQSAYLEFLRKQFTSKDTEAAAKNVMELNKRTNEELLRARKREDEIRENKIGQVESGLNWNLSENARLSNKSLADLALAKGYATDIYNQMLAAGATVFEAEREAERYQQTYGANLLSQTAPALLAELETYKTPQQRDAYIRSKASELGVSIDQVNSALQGAIAAKNKPITLSEGEAVYDPATGQFVIKNEKTFAPDTSNTFGNFNLTSGQQTLLNGIINKYNASPLVMASDRAAILEGAINAVKANPKDATLQLNLVYSYIQALDTYQSAVREGELGLVNSIDSKIGQLQGEVQKVQNGQVVRPEVALNIANAAQNILDTIDSAARQKAQSFRSQAEIFGLGQVWDAYVGGFTPGYGGSSGQTLDDIINNALGGQTGFNSVGNTSASTGRTPYLNTLGAVTGLNGSPLWKWGLDIDLKIGQPVRTPVSGQVIAVAPNGGFGNQVKIRAADGTEYWFSHLSKGLVKVGQKITKGAVIALGGNTGNTIPGKGGDGSHLDLTAKDRNGNYIPPSKIAQMLKQIYV